MYFERTEGFYLAGTSSENDSEPSARQIKDIFSVSSLPTAGRRASVVKNLLGQE